MKNFNFTFMGTFYHPNRNFKNCVNTMTRNIFTSHIVLKVPISESIKKEADKMPKGLKQFYADLFLLTVLKRARAVYDNTQPKEK